MPSPSPSRRPNVFFVSPSPLRLPSTLLIPSPPTCQLSLRAPISRRNPATKMSLPPLPPPVNHWAVSTLLLTSATLGLKLETTAIGAALSAPLVTMFTTLLLSNISLLPAASPLYSLTTRHLVPLAVPLLLFNADLRRALTQTGRLLSAFAVGTLGTLAGTLVAWKLVPLSASLGAADAWKIAAALCARHIGGAVNYVATVEATGAGAAAVTAGLAADNLIVALYFLLLFVLARDVDYVAEEGKRGEGGEGGGGDVVGGEDVGEGVGMRVVDMAAALSVSAAICCLGSWVAAVYLPSLGAIPVITAIVVALATAFPRKLRPLCAAGGGLGIFIMQVFFAVTGASGSVVAVLRTAPALFAFSAVQIAVHLAVVLGVGRLGLRMRMEDLLVASNANVGGPTTAAGMAAAKKWTGLVVPSLLVGVFGYAVATFLSLGMGHMLLRPR